MNFIIYCLHIVNCFLCFTLFSIYLKIIEKPKQLQKSVGLVVEWEVAIFSRQLLFLWYLFRAKNNGLTETIEIISVTQPLDSELMDKTFQGAQVTHERFLTIDHSCKILYVTYSTTHQRSVEVQFGRYQKNILQEWSMVKNVLVVQLETFSP